ncbi:MAG: nucleotidyltransferase domain-containing protein [Nanoarchaeota archaeon]|nr:nucleotidyltransferase domain-containing protein [Nanoarchaeota archaeon]
MKTSNIKEKLKNYFFINPTARLRVRQIERELKLPLPSVIRYAKELEKEGLLKITDIAGIRVYSADRASRQFIVEKMLFNIYSLHESGLVNLIIEELHNPAIILFGSYAKGEDIESSDIDIFIETPAKKPDFKMFEKKLNRNIQLFLHKSIKDIKNKELANNIINGIRLNGFIEVF